MGVGLDGAVVTSADGTNWVTGSIGSPFAIVSGVTYGDGQYVSVGDDAANRTSTNGVKWTLRSNGATVHLYGVAFGNGLFVTVGSREPMDFRKPPPQLFLRRHDGGGRIVS